MRKLLIAILIIAKVGFAFGQNAEYKEESNIPYYSHQPIEMDEYIKERCVLDIYYPVDAKGFGTVVWFHGGGLTTGGKELPEALKNQGLAIVGVNYRLHPKVSSPKYIEDAAAAISWVFNNIGSYGGDPKLIFISGHSAGGYLASMAGLDKRWLAAHGVDANQIAGIIPFSGQTITHFTIRKERGIENTQPVIDEFAPLFHVRADAPPLLLITGDRELEILGRYEENAYLMRMMKVAGHNETNLYELEGYDHNMVAPAFPLLLKEVQRIMKNRPDQ